MTKPETAKIEDYLEGYGPLTEQERQLVRQAFQDGQATREPERQSTAAWDAKRWRCHLNGTLMPCVGTGERMHADCRFPGCECPAASPPAPSVPDMVREWQKSHSPPRDNRIVLLHCPSSMLEQKYIGGFHHDGRWYNDRGLPLDPTMPGYPTRWLDFDSIDRMAAALTEQERIKFALYEEVARTGTYREMAEADVLRQKDRATKAEAALTAQAKTIEGLNAEINRRKDDPITKIKGEG